MVSLVIIQQACPDQAGQRSQWMIGDRTLDPCMSKTTDTAYFYVTRQSGKNYDRSVCIRQFFGREMSRSLPLRRFCLSRFQLNQTTLDNVITYFFVISGILEHALHHGCRR